MNKNDLLESMKAHSIPAGWSNLWYVSKINISNPITPIRHGKKVVLTPGQYTFLHRLTDGTLHRDLPGEVVMEDTPFELRTHLGFVMQAHGRVLVTGLGLGCVLRGLLSNPAVQHITCIENSRDVLKLVGAHMPRERLTILEADAFEWTAQNKEVFNCVWHDLWTDRDNGQPHLDVWHAQLFANCKPFAIWQGAWSFDRRAKRLLLKHGFPWIG